MDDDNYISYLFMSLLTTVSLIKEQHKRSNKTD
jgi:hypothetical protein